MKDSTPQEEKQQHQLVELPVVTSGEYPVVTMAVPLLPQPKRRWWIVTVSALSVVILGLTMLATYLWGVSEKWEERVERLSGEAYSLGEQLSSERTVVSNLQQKLDLTSEQLAASKQRLTELSGERSRAGDDIAYYQQKAQEYSELISESAEVTTALNRCVEGRKNLTAYLKEAELYAPEDLANLEQNVTSLCDSAQQAATSFIGKLS